MHYQCTANALPMHYQCGANAMAINCHYSANALLMQCQCSANVLSKCSVNALPMQCQCSANAVPMQPYAIQFNAEQYLLEIQKCFPPVSQSVLQSVSQSFSLPNGRPRSVEQSSRSKKGQTKKSLLL